MAGQRRINWGADATDARYRTEDTGDGANFVVAEDLDGATVLLEYDTSVTPSEWKVRGPVEMTGNDVSGVGTLTANSVETVEESIEDPTDGVKKKDVRTIEETETHVDAHYRQFGNHPAGAQTMRGTRELGMTLYNKDNFGTDFTSTGQSLAVFNVPPIYHPPGKVPFVYVDAVVSHTDDTADAGVALNMVDRTNSGARGSNQLTLSSAVPGTGTQNVIMEAYLGDFVDNYATSVKKQMPRFEITGVTNASTATAERLTVCLGYEVR